MYGIDLMLISAVFAALFTAIATVFLQKKWRVYDVFIGKKRALLVHGGLMGLVTVELLIVSVIDLESKWLFPTFWPVGILVVATAGWLFVQALREAGFGVLINASIFRHKKPKKGPIWQRYKQPLYVSYVTFYIGLALLTGHIAYLIVALCLGVGLAALYYITRA